MVFAASAMARPPTPAPATRPHTGTPNSAALSNNSTSTASIPSERAVRRIRWASSLFALILGEAVTGWTLAGAGLVLFWPALLMPAIWWTWQALHAPPPGLALENGARLEWVDCWFETSWLRPVHCGRLHTAPEPGALPTQFALPVVYLPQRPWKRRGPPVLYISGGPGGSSWLEADAVDFWFEAAVTTEDTDWTTLRAYYPQ